MIPPDLLSKLACPVCLEPQGCDACRRDGPGHAGCLSGYEARAACACGGPDKVRLAPEDPGLRCPCCNVLYPVNGDEGYVDLVPRTSVGEVTQYADHDFHEHLHVTDTPPLLSARVKADMMLGMLGLGPGEAVLDLGCGAGKMALYAGSRGARPAGLDVAPFFLPRAGREVALVLGDLRRLPFRKGAFPRAYSLDVLEHLDETGVREVLVEARRTVGASGRLFVYTHAMESSRLAAFQRAVNRLARRLGERGIIDHAREAMRKSDHRNAIRSHEHFEALCQAAGLRVKERRYYNVVFKAVVEDLLLRLYEQRRRRGAPSAPGTGHDQAHAEPKPPGRGLIAVGRALTMLLKLDVLLFGRIRTGPFFGLLEPAAREGPR